MPRMVAGRQEAQQLAFGIVRRFGGAAGVPENARDAARSSMLHTSSAGRRMAMATHAGRRRRRQHDLHALTARQ